MVDTGVRRVGRALQRRQSMVDDLNLAGMWEIQVVVVVIIVVEPAGGRRWLSSWSLDVAVVRKFERKLSAEPQPRGPVDTVDDQQP